MLEYAAIRKLLPYIIASAVTLGLVIALAITRHTLKSARADLKLEQSAHVLDIKSWETASAQATAAAQSAARATEQRNATISQESQDALSKQLADARSVAAAYAKRMRDTASADRGSPGQADMPRPADPASGTDSAGRNALIPEADLSICADNTVKAKGWQDWWSKVSKP